MAHFSAHANLCPNPFPPRRRRTTTTPPPETKMTRCSSSPSSSFSGGSVSASYLEMWRKAMETKRKSQQFRGIASERPQQGKEGDDGGGVGRGIDDDDDSLQRKTEEFHRILDVPRQERDRIQRLQIIDRAAAAIAAARYLLKQGPKSSAKVVEPAPAVALTRSAASEAAEERDSESLDLGTPGPDFWSWSPPSDAKSNSTNFINLQPESKSNFYVKSSLSLMEKEKSMDVLSIPFQSTVVQGQKNILPPLQSRVEVEKTIALPATETHLELNELFSSHAVEAAKALGESSGISTHGVNPDGSRWWKETGTEKRSDGVVCRWTLIRSVSVDGALEWEDKYWEASDQFDYKELGSEKCGRDADGNVWREYWKESMWQDLKSGLFHMEKTADKWGKDSIGTEWHEKWWEHYDASGQAQKWAHKWCSIDRSTPLQDGHAHTWHERWGEKYDGKGGSNKYADKWAERWEVDGWEKWGDKWDENFSPEGHGVKQGETWWEGKYGDKWNRTWGEHHNGTGWIHKYGKSSSGEHWDTHSEEDTWYEKYPHFGFDNCFRNSVPLRAVRRPPLEF